MNQINGRVLNWRPDLPDHRDYLYKPSAAQPVVSSVDYRSQMPPITNQGSLSTCSWHAITAAMGYIEKQQLKQPGKQSLEYDPTKYISPSVMFGYYNARLLEGTQNTDGGAYIRDGIKTASQQGVCRDSLWPDIASNLYVKPNIASYIDALNFKISQYQRLTTLDDMKSSLSSGFPFVFGFTVFQGFYNLTRSNSTVPLPLATDRAYGGHAVVACGYLESKKVFIVRNSWGTSFGIDGYCYFPYDYLIPKFSSDFWTIRV